MKVLWGCFLIIAYAHTGYRATVFIWPSDPLLSFVTGAAFFVVIERCLSLFVLGKSGND